MQVSTGNGKSSTGRPHDGHFSPVAIATSGEKFTPPPEAERSSVNRPSQTGWSPTGTVHFFGHDIVHLISGPARVRRDRATGTHLFTFAPKASPELLL